MSSFTDSVHLQGIQTGSRAILRFLNNTAMHAEAVATNVQGVQISKALFID